MTSDVVPVFHAESPISGDQDPAAHGRYLSQAEPFVAQGSARAFQRDLFFYWSTVHTQPVSLTRQDRLYRKDMRRVNAALLYPEPIFLPRTNLRTVRGTWTLQRTRPPNE